MKNTQRVIITMLISIIFITIVGMYFKIRAINILKLSLSSLVLEILIHYFAYKQNRPQITLSKTFDLYKKFVKKTLPMSIVIITFVGYKIFFSDIPNILSFFYCHIIVVFYTVGYILCLNNNILKNERE